MNTIVRIFSTSSDSDPVRFQVEFSWDHDPGALDDHEVLINGYVHAQDSISALRRAALEKARSLLQTLLENP